MTPAIQSSLTQSRKCCFDGCRVDNSRLFYCKKKLDNPVDMFGDLRFVLGVSIVTTFSSIDCIGMQLVCTHGIQIDTSYASRRAFVSASSGTLVGFSSLLVNSHPALADPMNAFLPPGVGRVVQPIVERQENVPWELPNLGTSLGKTRIGSISLAPLQQGPFANNELYYAPFLFGSWDVTATLRQKIYPFGKDFVPSKSLVEGSPRYREEKVGDTTSFSLHYFSTLADTLSNQMVVNMGLGVPQTKIIADRAYNIISMSVAYQQLTPVEEVDWDYRTDPTRLTLRYGAAPVAPDMRPLGQRRGEIYLTARQTELSEDGSTFCAAERSRSISVGAGTVSATDQESITEFQKVNDGSVKAISRIAVYLTPNPNSREGALWQQIGGKAVAFFDYDWTMTRVNEEFSLSDGSKVLRPCVKTPKDIIQCE